MKRFLFALSILFCTTVFANNSFADCPSITPNYELEGIPVKIIADDPADGPVYIIAQPFEYNGTCFVWYSWMGRVFGLMSDYPSGTGTDYSNANISQPLEFCSETEAYQAFTDPTVYATLLYQSYEESVDFDPVGDNIYVAIFENSFLRQRCPITCDAGEVLYHDIYYKHCTTCRSEEECCLTEETTFTLSDYKDLESGNSLCYASGGNDPTGDDPTGEEPSSGGSAPARLRMSTLTPDNADGTIIASGAYAKGAYNANVGNINNALTYVEDSSVETIKHATVSAENVSLSVAGFTPAGTIDVDSSNATVSGTVNVANTVAMLSQWGTNSTENGTLSGSQQVSITNGAVTGMTGSFSGPASGQLSGTGTLSNASVHVNNWVPVNPQQ